MWILGDMTTVARLCEEEDYNPFERRWFGDKKLSSGTNSWSDRHCALKGPEGTGSSIRQSQPGTPQNAPMYLINLLQSPNLEVRGFQTGLHRFPWGLCGMRVRGRGLTSPSCPPLQCFHQFHMEAFSWDLERRGTKWDILGYGNRGGHWSHLPKELPRAGHRLDGAGELKSLRAQAALGKVNDYCTGGSCLASVFGDSPARKRNGWP